MLMQEDSADIKSLYNPYRRVIGHKFKSRIEYLILASSTL